MKNRKLPYIIFIILVVTFLFIALNKNYNPLGESTASLLVYPSEEISEINENIYGNNVAWIRSGLGVWDNYNNKLNPIMVEKAKGNIPILRFPGGCLADGYKWKLGVGPIERRGLMPDEYGGSAINLFGTDEFIQFCNAVGCKDKMITVNPTTGTSEEASEWVNYANNIKNYNIKYWEIGNEMSGCGKIASAGEYVNKVIDFSRKMKSKDPDIKIGLDISNSWGVSGLKDALPYVDFVIPHYYPTSISLTSITFYSNNELMKIFNFPSTGEYTFKFIAKGTEFEGWPVLELKIDGKQTGLIEVSSGIARDYFIKQTITKGDHKISINFINDKYTPGVGDRNLIVEESRILSNNMNKKIEWHSPEEYAKTVLSSPNDVDLNIKNIKKNLSYYGYKDKGIMVTEYNYHSGCPEELYNLATGLSIGDMIQKFIINDIDGADIWLYGTHWCHGAISKDNLAERPSYLALQMYIKHFGKTLIKTDSFSSTYDIAVPGFNKGENVPYIDAISSKSDDGKIYLMVINKNIENSIISDININGLKKDYKVNIWTLNGPDVISNNEKNPDNVNIKKTSISSTSSKFKYKFPAHSITAMEFS